MKKLISVGLIVAALAVMVVPALTVAYIIPGGGGGGSQSYSTEYFYHTQSTASIGGWVKAIEGDSRELKLIIWANSAYEDWGINDLELVVALWSQDNPVLYRTYRHQEIIDFDVGYWTYTLSVKEDGIIDSPKYGLACVYANAEGYNPDGGHFNPYYITYAIKFIDGAAPEIYLYPGVIPGRWTMYRDFQMFPDYYG